MTMMMNMRRKSIITTIMTTPKDAPADIATMRNIMSIIITTTPKDVLADIVIIMKRRVRLKSMALVHTYILLVVR